MNIHGVSMKEAAEAFAKMAEITGKVDQDPVAKARAQSAWEQRWRRAGLFGCIEWLFLTGGWPPRNFTDVGRA